MRCTKRRAVSEIVGVLLMLAIVVSLGVLIFTFSTNGLHSLSEGYSAAMSERQNAEAEKFKVVQAAFTTPSAALGGSATNTATGSSGSIAATLTTSGSNDLVVAYVSPADTGATAPPSVSGISGGGLTWTHRVSAPTETYTQDTYVPITLTNSQTTATPNPFQQKVTWDPATYSTDEASDLGNVRFCSDDACNTPLYAWLESCTPSCSPTATSASAWVKLTSAIGASGGTLTIYMVFEGTSTEFDGVYWGEAPNLSPSYAQYDNGANVFSFYDNFAGTTLSSKWTTVETGSTVTVDNGVTFTEGASTADYAFIEAATSAYPSVAETYMVSISSNSADPTMGVSTNAGVNTGVDPYAGYALDDIPTTLTLAVNTAGASTEVSHNTAEGFEAGIWDMIWSATGAESASDGVATLTGTNTGTTIANYGIFVGQSNNVGSTSNVVRWARERAYPPSDVMPTVAPGSTGTASITFDVEEWYAIAASPLSAATITATLSTSDTAATWIAVFGVSGADTLSPFDPNAAVPATASGTSPSTTMSTSDQSDVLLFACAAGSATMPSGFTSIYSSLNGPNQDEYVGYEAVASTQSSLATSCGTSSFGSEATDAVVESGGADLYVRNVGSIPTTIAAVYVTDVTTGSLVAQATPGTTIDVESFAEIPHNTLVFTPVADNTYSFTVTSSLGNSVIYTEEVG